MNIARKSAQQYEQNQIKLSGRKRLREKKKDAKLKQILEEQDKNNARLVASSMKTLIGTSDQVMEDLYKDDAPVG